MNRPCDAERIIQALDTLRARRPLVHNITNYVVMNSTANTLLALGNNNQKPDYAWHEGTAFQLFNLSDGATAVSEVPAADGSVLFTLKASRQGDVVTFTGTGDAQNWSVCLRNVQKVGGVKGGSHAGSEWGVVVKAEGDEVVVHL